MRHSYAAKRVKRRVRKPAELLLVPMIDIFTVLVTFLLMTAVFSRTVILELKLPPPNSVFREPPPGLQLEVIVRSDSLEVADRATGPLADIKNVASGYDYTALGEYLQRVKSKYPDKTDASVLLEPGISYDTLVQVMDHVRVLEVNAGLSTQQFELFPDVSIGDAPPAAAATNAPAAQAVKP